MGSSIRPGSPEREEIQELSNIESNIIICAYNEEKTVVDVVSACCELNQRSEVIVVDDGSTDRTPALLADLVADLDFRYERFPVNRGRAGRWHTE